MNIDLLTITGLLVAFVAIAVVAYMERRRFGCQWFNMPNHAGRDYQDE
jgi:hypothetical protein